MNVIEHEIRKAISSSNNKKIQISGELHKVQITFEDDVIDEYYYDDDDKLYFAKKDDSTGNYIVSVLQ